MEDHEAVFVVRTFECRSDGKIKIASLMQYLQEAAASHAERLGVGFDTLRQMGAYWALSNFRMDMTRLPVWSEHVVIRTWPSGYNRVLASREFVGVDRDGGELFRAGSEWMILDKQRNRPKNLFRLDLDLPKAGEKALPEKLNRLQAPTGYRAVDRLRVPYSSIDLNGHVNNTEYVRWGFDALRRAVPVEGDIRCVQVTYLSEVFEGDELDVLVACGADGDFHVLGKKSDAKTDVYRMEVRL